MKKLKGRVMGRYCIKKANGPRLVNPNVSRATGNPQQLALRSAARV